MVYNKLDHDKWKPFVTSDFNSTSLPVMSLLSDREGSLWIGTAGIGLYRISGQKVDRFRRADGLSNDGIVKIFEDREGNLWTTSAEEIDCFRNTLVTMFLGPEGLGSGDADGVTASKDGAIWISRVGSLGGIKDHKWFSIRAGNNLPGKQVTSILEDHDGKSWVGIDRTLSKYQN